MNWLNQLDPTFVLGLATALGGYVWSKLRGEKTDTARERLKSIALTAAAEYAATGMPQYAMRQAIEARARTLLNALGVKGKLVDALVSEAVERGIAELNSKLAAATLAHSMSALAERAVAAGAALDKAATSPTIPRLDSMMTVEVVPPDEDLTKP